MDVKKLFEEWYREVKKNREIVDLENDLIEQHAEDCMEMMDKKKEKSKKITGGALSPEMMKYRKDRNIWNELFHALRLAYIVDGGMSEKEAGRRAARDLLHRGYPEPIDPTKPKMKKQEVAGDTEGAFAIEPSGMVGLDEEEKPGKVKPAKYLNVDKVLIDTIVDYDLPIDLPRLKPEYKDLDIHKPPEPKKTKKKKADVEAETIAEPVEEKPKKSRKKKAEPVVEKPTIVEQPKEDTVELITTVGKKKTTTEEPTSKLSCFRKYKKKILRVRLYYTKDTQQDVVPIEFVFYTKQGKVSKRSTYNFDPSLLNSLKRKGYVISKGSVVYISDNAQTEESEFVKIDEYQQYGSGSHPKLIESKKIPRKEVEKFDNKPGLSLEDVGLYYLKRKPKQGKGFDEMEPLEFLKSIYP